MQTYTVHLPPKPELDREQLAERMVLVPDGFQLLAFVVPPLWFLMRGLWLGLLGYVVVVGALEAAMWALSVPAMWQALTGLALHLVIAFEAAPVWRWTLDRNGWLEAGVVSGRSVDECERRFLDGWLGAPRPRYATY